jgi:hypothetical protein
MGESLFVDCYFVVFSDESTSTTLTLQAVNHNNNEQQDETYEDERT